MAAINKPIDTVTLFKDGDDMIVNAVDAPAWLEKGWTRENKAEAEAKAKAEAEAKAKKGK